MLQRHLKVTRTGLIRKKVSMNGLTTQGTDFFLFLKIQISKRKFMPKTQQRPLIFSKNWLNATVAQRQASDCSPS